MGMHKNKFLFILFCLIALPFLLYAHASHPELENLSGGNITLRYIQLGFTHILPLGLDHILFVLSIYLLNPNIRQVLWQTAAFTLAHSITLALAILGIISPDPHIVEPLIALSIVMVALENFFTDKVSVYRIVLIFGFGLVHGMGFSGVLSELGMPKSQFVNALVSFNVGVELGQITVILLAYFIVVKWFRHEIWFRKRIVYPASGTIALVALYWTIERIFFT